MTKLEGYPFEFEDVDQETNTRMKQLQPYAMMTGAMTIGPDRYFYPKVPLARFLAMYNYPLHTSDTWVVTMPKCGTTWTQEMVWLIANNCDFEAAKTPLMPDRWEFLEMSHRTLMPDRAMLRVLFQTAKNSLRTIPRLVRNVSSLMFSKSQQPPRFIKTHLPLSMCPPQLLNTCKTIYVARNPKDALISYYHHHKLLMAQGFEGTFEEFFELFMESKLFQLPFLPHIKEAWNRRDNPNLLFLFYEDMKADLKAVIDKVAAFLGKTLDSCQKVQLYEHLQFDSMKNNEFVNMEPIKNAGLMNKEGNFIRKGKTGDWKNHLTDEMSARMDAWIEQNLKDCSLRFTTELAKQD